MALLRTETERADDRIAGVFKVQREDARDLAVTKVRQQCERRECGEEEKPRVKRMPRRGNLWVM
jgi:hypothetical protein